MSIVTQFFEYNDLCEVTKLQLFAEANRAFNSSLYQNDEDPDVKAWGKRAEIRLQEIYYVFKILGIYDEYMKSCEIDVTTALEKNISLKEAHDARVFARA